MNPEREGAWCAGPAPYAYTRGSHSNRCPLWLWPERESRKRHEEMERESRKHHEEMMKQEREREDD